MRNPFESTGIVIRRNLNATSVFAGSAFAYRNQKWFVTAAHVVRGLHPEDVGVALFLDQALEDEEGLSVREVYRHPSADLAVLELDLAAAFPLEIFDPFAGVRAGTELGEATRCFGFPTQSATEGVVLVPRMLRGHVQRHFIHDSPYGFRYRAFQLSHTAPDGMSGSPVSAENDPSRVVGLLTEDFQSSTVLHSINEVEQDGTKLVDRAHAVVNFGVAIDLEPLRDWLADITS